MISKQKSYSSFPFQSRINKNMLDTLVPFVGLVEKKITLQKWKFTSIKQMESEIYLKTCFLSCNGYKRQHAYYRVQISFKFTNKVSLSVCCHSSQQQKQIKFDLSYLNLFSPFGKGQATFSSLCIHRNKNEKKIKE